jgi:Tfp pilus assembly protein PilF
VKLLVDLPEHGLSKGQEGTVLLVFNDHPEHYLVEFADEEGVEIATVGLAPEQVEVFWSFAEHRSNDEQSTQRTAEEKAKLYFEQGMIYLQNGLLDQAKEKFSRAFDIDPSYAGTLTNNALPLAEGEHWDQATFIYRLVLSLQPDYQLARDKLAIAYLNRGVEQARKKQYGQALESFHQALEINASEKIWQQVQTNILATFYGTD